MINWYYDDVQLDYSDVLMVPNQGSIKSRSEIELPVQIYQKLPTSVPIIASNMDHVGTFEMARALSKHKILTCLVKHYSLEDLLNFYKTEPEVAQYCIYSMGANDSDYSKLREFLNVNGFPSAICIDVANAYSDYVKEFVETIFTSIDDANDNCVLIVGNVVTSKMVVELFDAGADVIKVGIGSGSVCTTRTETGIGYPQFSAISECYNVAKNLGVGIIADGGITCPGDAAKAFAVGAQFVMLGGELAGHDEGYTDRELWESKELEWYGMSSRTAQERHGGTANYRSSEGASIYIPRRGPVEKTVNRYLNGLRSACAYLGAKNTTEMHDKAKFILVNNQRNRSML